MAKTKTEEKTEQVTEKVMEQSVEQVKVTVVSRVNFPVTLKYNNDEIILSPKQRLTFTDKTKLDIRPDDAKHIRLI